MDQLQMIRINFGINLKSELFDVLWFFETFIWLISDELKAKDKLL